VKEDEMDGACGKKLERKGKHIGYWWESQKKINTGKTKV
jgi:hypothetical protein